MRLTIPWNPETIRLCGLLSMVICTVGSSEGSGRSCASSIPEITCWTMIVDDEGQNSPEYNASAGSMTGYRPILDQYVQLPDAVCSKTSQNSMAPKLPDPNTSYCPISGVWPLRKFSTMSDTSKSSSETASTRTLSEWQTHAWAITFPWLKLTICKLSAVNWPQLTTCCRTASMKSSEIALCCETVEWNSGSSIFSGFCTSHSSILITRPSSRVWSPCRKILPVRADSMELLMKSTSVVCYRLLLSAFTIITRFSIGHCPFSDGWPQNCGDAPQSTETAWSHTITHWGSPYFSTLRCSPLTFGFLPY